MLSGPRAIILLVPLLLIPFSLPAQVRDIVLEPTRIVYQGKPLYENSWAVLVGINRYRSERIKPLQAALNDVRLMRETLLRLGFSSERILTLTEGQATRQAIERLLGDRLRRQLGEEDRLFIYFATHGQDEEVKRGEFERYLIPYDADPDALFSSSISMTRLKEVVGRIPAKHVLIAVDACYSGYAIFAGRTGIVNPELVDELTRRPAIQVLTAGRKGELAQEKEGHGVFTRALAAALRGAADTRGWGWMSLEDVGTYVRDRVYADTNRGQYPRFGNLSGDGQFVFVLPAETRLPPRPEPPRPGVGPPPRDPAAELLARADGLIARRALTTPPGANAFEVLQEILRGNPTHPGALERLERIANTYKAWAKQALDRGQREQARGHLQSAKRMVPEDREIAELEAKLAGPPPEPPVAAAGRGDLYVASEPPGARIEIDGRPHDQPTPVLVRGVAAGKRRLVLRRGEEHGAVKEVDVVAGELQNVQISLSRLKGTLYVNVEPFEAEVKVNGRPFGRGRSPVRGEIETGTYRVEVIREGYRTLEREVVVRFAETTEVGGRLAAIPQGTLVVESDPAGAEVIIGGKSHGPTPRALRLYEGRYRVSLKKEGYEERTQEVMVPGGGTGRVAVVLPKIPIPPGMVLVPAGEFIMGDNHGDGSGDEKPSRRVYLDAFYMDKYPVTNEGYRKFMEATGHRKPESWENSNFNAPRQPVVGVSWDEAGAYCRWAGKRLPTEAEWEKAARGPDGRKYPWGNEWDPEKAIFSANSGGKTHPVDRTYNTHRSVYGAVDMAGNVWQWVADWYDEGYYARGENRNPRGPASGSARVLRGGSWYNDPRYLRAPYRIRFSPTDRDFHIGLRCAGAP